MASNVTEFWQDAEVIDPVELAAGMRRILLRPTVPLTVAPGAHIGVRLPIAGAIDDRSYSIVDGDRDGSRIDVSVFESATSRGGAAFMHTLRVGDRLGITRPVVSIALRIGAPRYIILAGGICITAVAAVAATLGAIGVEYRLVYVPRSRQTMAYLDGLATLHGDRLRVQIGGEGTHSRWTSWSVRSTRPPSCMCAARSG